MFACGRHPAEFVDVAHQFIVAAARADPAVGDEDQPIAMLDRGQAMGDHEQGLAALQRLNRARHVGLGDLVECGGGLIEYQQVGIVIERAGDPDALPLAAREANTAFTDHSVEAGRQRRDQLIELHHPDHGAHAIKVDLGVGEAERNVASQAVVEQKD